MTALLRTEDVRSYSFEIRTPDSAVAILALHGGEIEWATNQVAEAIAGDDYRLFSFNGHRLGGQNFRYLHVTSTNYDEPQCQSLIETCTTVIAIHGWDDLRHKMPAVINPGGLDQVLREAVCSELRHANFNVAEFDDPSNKFRGQISSNICNRGKTRAGVQLEIPKSLRQSIVPRSGRRPAEFDNLVDAIRQAIGNVLPRR